MKLQKPLILLIFFIALGAGFLLYPPALSEYQVGDQAVNNLSQELPLGQAQSATSSAEIAPILMYHYIENSKATTTLPSLYVKPAILENQLQELAKAKFSLAFVSEIAQELKNKKAVPAKTIALTFDDGYEDFYTQAFPLLKKYQAKATVYVIINTLGKPGYLTKEQVRELAASGLVEIGSHTFNHPDLRQKKFKDANFEIRESRIILEQISGRPVLTFAYPYGYYNPAAEKIVSESGYQAAVSVIPESRQSDRNLWLLYRLRPNGRQGQEFIKWLDDWLLRPKN